MLGSLPQHSDRFMSADIVNQVTANYESIYTLVAFVRMMFQYML